MLVPRPTRSVLCPGSWRAGCLLYELMCLKVPFEARDLPGLVRKILTSPYVLSSPMWATLATRRCSSPSLPCVRGAGTLACPASTAATCRGCWPSFCTRTRRCARASARLGGVLCVSGASLGPHRPLSQRRPTVNAILKMSTMRKAVQQFAVKLQTRKFGDPLVAAVMPQRAPSPVPVPAPAPAPAVRANLPAPRQVTPVQGHTSNPAAVDGF